MSIYKGDHRLDGGGVTGGRTVTTEWGDILGVLSAQTDLQNALNAKATNEDLERVEDSIPVVVDNTSTADSNKALSANMGKSLQDQIAALQTRGRYLSIWDCTTGLATTTPTTDPYLYKAGDYFIVGVVGATNYKPTGTQYSEDTPSTVIETGDVKVNDTYYYDGTTWSLLDVGTLVTSFSGLAGSPYDNNNLASALNEKQDELPTGTAGQFLKSTGSGIEFATVSQAPTPAVSSNTTDIATTAYINTKFQVVDALPANPDANTFYFVKEA